MSAGQKHTQCDCFEHCDFLKDTKGQASENYKCLSITMTGNKIQEKESGKTPPATFLFRWFSKSLPITHACFAAWGPFLKFKTCWNCMLGLTYAIHWLFQKQKRKEMKNQKPQWVLSHRFQYLQIRSRTKLNFQDERELPHELPAENAVFLSTALTRSTFMSSAITEAKI